jgi:hypothetical protein
VLLAAAVLTLPAVARVFVIGDSKLWGFVPSLTLLLILCAGDLWRENVCTRFISSACLRSSP